MANGFTISEKLKVLVPNGPGQGRPGHYRGLLNNYQYYFGGVLNYKYRYNGSQKPVLIIKAPT